MTGDTSYGKLIFDLNGEYVLRGTNTYGLGDIDDKTIRENVVVYTDKKLPPEYADSKRFIHGGNVHLNLSSNLTINDILQAATGLTNPGKTFLQYLDSLPNDTDKNEFLDLIFNEEDPKQVRAYAYKKFASYFDIKENDSKEPKENLKAMLGAVIRQIKSFNSINDKNSKLIDTVMKYLKQGKTVIVDLSLKDSIDASLISHLLIRKLFESNKANFTSEQTGKVINTVIFVEEAQNVLSEEFVKSNANPFVRVAKEGRKFGLGLVAITQRPSAISEEIRTQAENFFAFHMGNSDDIKALVKSNINYDGVIANFIQRETIVGNLYMVSSDQAFALPVRVSDFGKLVESKVYKESKFAK